MQQDTIQQMCNQLSSLNLSQPSVMGMLKCMELTEVVQGTRSKKRSETDILSEWLNIENSVVLAAVQDESDEDECRSSLIH